MPITPPVERFACQGAGERSAVPAEQPPRWDTIDRVDQARESHERYVASVRSRELILVNYIVATEAKLFACATNAEWLRNFYSDIANN